MTQIIESSALGRFVTKESASDIFNFFNKFLTNVVQYYLHWSSKPKWLEKEVSPYTFSCAHVHTNHFQQNVRAEKNCSLYGQDRKVRIKKSKRSVEENWKHCYMGTRNLRTTAIDPKQEIRDHHFTMTVVGLGQSGLGLMRTQVLCVPKSYAYPSNPNRSKSRYICLRSYLNRPNRIVACMPKIVKKATRNSTKDSNIEQTYQRSLKCE